MDIALVGVIATLVAFRIVGMTTGREAGAPLNRNKFLLHLGVMAALFLYCIVSGLFSFTSGRGRERQQGLADRQLKAEACLAAGRTAEATALASEALAMAEKTYGADNARILPVLDLQAKCLGREQKFAEAEATAQRALAIATKAHGKGSPEEALEENNLGTLYVDMGKLDRAEALFRSALANTERITGQIPPVLPAVLENLAVLCEQTERAEEAQRLRARARVYRGQRP
ncbi:MAG: tetratricopeptide repeat protein [Planctomycetes bacterium]|nr:tetratricopeptide repeat protein [Planctomycetota bacterium]